VKKIIALCLILLLVFSLVACDKKDKDNNDGKNGELIPIEDSESTESNSNIDYSSMDTQLSKRDITSQYDENSAVKIAYNNNIATVSGKGASAKGTNVSVTAEGTYILSGKSNDGSLTVEADSNDKIQLVFKNFSLTNKDGVAIYIKSADKVFITLADGTENNLSDGGSYTATDGDTTLDATLFSRADLTINGSGSLNVKGNYKHAIVSKDDLVIVDSSIEVEANNVGLNGKDCVKIQNAEISVVAGTDGIRSDNSEDTNRGFIYIYSGKIKINAANDGIQAQTLLQIEDVTADIISGEGSENSSWKSNGDWNKHWGGWGNMPQGQIENDDGAASAKGIKAGGNIVINKGNIIVDSSDDSIHSNSNITVKEGVLKLSSGDDGIHADTDFDILGGEITVSKSYEGLEATNITISGGNISVTAQDDGINAAGGNDGSAMGGRPGQSYFSSLVGAININGGYILIDAIGDGVDSNGTIDINGGVLLVNGPTSNGNSAFDHDGKATASGGVVVAVGSAGMAETFNSAENQGAIYTTFDTQNAGTSIALCSSDGKVIVSFTPTKSYQSAVITAPNIKKGASYKVVAGAKINNIDKNGFAQNTTKQNGNNVAEITMTDWLYKESMSGFHGGGGMTRR